jgi:iron complex outermembrane recepter protein
VSSIRDSLYSSLVSSVASFVAPASRNFCKPGQPVGPKRFLPGLLVTIAVPLFSQTGQIAGTVRDPAQAVIVGARVVATDPATKSSGTATTTDEGEYVISGLPPGTYHVETQVKGFKTSIVDGLRVTAGESSSLDIKLEFVTPKTSVNVVATAGDVYVVENIQKVGPFSQTPIQDLPYSIDVISQDLIENLQASTVDQLFRINPFVEPQVPQTRTGSGVGYIRGFNVSAQREDGLYSAFPIVDIEDKQEVEVLTGTSGFLYGINPPGGLVDYVLKHPTPARYSSLEFGTYGGAALYGHADLGGPIDKDGKFGYRLNLVGQDGETAIQNQSVTRFLISGALDWHVARNAVLEIDASDSSYRVDGSPAVWQFVSPGPPPPAPSASKLWGQKYDFDKYRTNKERARFKWDLNNIFTVRVGFARMSYERTDFYTNNEINPGNASYNIIVLPFAPREIATYSGQALIDAVFRTGFIKHKVTVGFDGSNYGEKRHQDQSAVITLGTASDFSNPTYLPIPSYAVGVKPLVDFGQTLETNYVIGDMMEFSKSWSAIAGVDNSGVIQKNYSLAPALLSTRYDKRAWTPTASLIYKPVSKVSTYFTYMEGLMQGGTAPTTAANAGVQLPPDLSRTRCKGHTGKGAVDGSAFRY